MSAISKFLSSFVILSVLGLVGSERSEAGIIYTDPVPLRAALSYQTNISTWSVHLQKARLYACNGGGSYTDVQVNATMDATHGFEVPVGCWEDITLYFDGDFYLTGYNPNNQALSLTLDVSTATLVMDGGDLNVVSSNPTQTAIIELLGLDWYQDELEPYVNNNAPVTVTSSHGRHAALVSNLANYSTLLLISIP